jgi:hypothetical protein
MPSATVSELLVPEELIERKVMVDADLAAILFTLRFFRNGTRGASRVCARHLRDAACAACPSPAHQVATKALNQAVQRNFERFPEMRRRL